MMMDKGMKQKGYFQRVKNAYFIPPGFHHNSCHLIILLW